MIEVVVLQHWLKHSYGNGTNVKFYVEIVSHIKGTTMSIDLTVGCIYSHIETPEMYKGDQTIQSQIFKEKNCLNPSIQNIG